MFETHVGPVAGEGSEVYLRPETAQGIFINFKNVLGFARKKPPFGIAQIGKSFRNEITPGNFIFRTREFEQMEMEFFVPPAEAERWYRTWIEERERWYTELGIRPEFLRVRAPRGRRALPLLLGDERRRVPLPDRLVGARGDRQPRRLRPHPARQVQRREARVLRPADQRALRAPRDRAGGRRRPRHARLPGRRLRRRGGRGPPAHRAAPPPPPGPGQGRRAAARLQGGHAGEGPRDLRGAAPPRPGRVRRGRLDRQALPPPGRDRHPLGHHRRPPDDGGRHRHPPRPRLARAGPRADRGPGRRPRRRASPSPGAARSWTERRCSRASSATGTSASSPDRSASPH